MYKTYYLTKASVSETKDEFGLTNTGDLINLSNSSTILGQIPVVQKLEKQKDLLNLFAVLFSIGVNKNLDVFIPEEVLPIRNTGAHKPLNLEHDQNKIVGHMIRTFAALKDGTLIKDEDIPNTDKFDIMAESVLYKFLFPDLCKEVQNKALNNELFVSVEVWFSDYDYLVGNDIVKRNSETEALLESKLLCNKGSGEINGKRVGRVLRKMLIGGIGLVKNPANPESVIKSVNNANSEDVLYNTDIIEENLIDQQIIDIGEINMDNKVLEEYAQILSACEASAKCSDKKDEQVVSQDSTSPVPTEMKNVLDRLSKLEEANKELEVRAIAAENKAKTEKRASDIKNIGLNSELTENAFSLFAFMDEEVFGKHLDLLKMAMNFVEDKYKKLKDKEKAEGGDKATIDSTDTVENLEDKTNVENSNSNSNDNDVKNDIETDTDEAEDEVDLTEVDYIDAKVDLGSGAPETNKAPSVMDLMIEALKNCGKFRV